jgi:hypothetical protein
MKTRILKTILAIGLLTAPVVPTHSVAQARSRRNGANGPRRRGGAGRRVGVGAAGGAAIGGIAGRGFGGAAIGGAAGAGAGALFHRHQRRRGR